MTNKKNIPYNKARLQYSGTLSTSSVYITSRNEAFLVFFFFFASLISIEQKYSRFFESTEPLVWI